MAACIAAAYAVSADGQSQPQPAPTCAELLTTPTRDSLWLNVMLSVHAYDRDRDLPAAVQLTFGEAILKRLALPKPLGVDAYEISRDTAPVRTAHLTLRGSYGAVLTADGRVINASATGGARNGGFDVAMLAAMNAIDSTDLLPLAFGDAPKADIPIRLEIAARDSANRRGTSMLKPLMVTAFTTTTRERTGMTPRVPPSPVFSFPPEPADSESGLPLFRFRVPVREVTSSMTQIPGIGGLRYPSDRHQPGTLGKVRVSFVVDADGRAEPASTQIVNATQREFALAVLDA
ncbi:MAG: hypothetical protein JWM87_2449, partial [Candidatus Eremiobacteraeota bacterium]|nr:hypothetical protein [Candidatus Eremiobacteraeota bacterium]